MYLYNLTLHSPGAIVQAACGNFSGTKAQEVIVSKGKILELLRPDENGKIQSILSVDIFGVILSILAFRLTGSAKDYLIVGSDSGRIVILEYNPTKNTFDKVHQETFGKSGVRRIVPGQYLATDPKGRAVMIGAPEKCKFVYILNRDSASRLTISSPLEAHKNSTVLFAVVGVDVGFENPQFACLEVDYEDDDGYQKVLTIYELDLGLNHVVRKWSEAVDPKSNTLIPVPGGNDGPGGLLVCSEDYVTYKAQGHEEIRAKIPRRVDSDPTRGVMLIQHATHKLKEGFFFLVQSEYGDLYKITMSYKDDQVKEIVIKYFDTIAVCNTVGVMKTGFLFAAAEAGNHAFYQIQSLGEDDNVKYEQIQFGNDSFPCFHPRKLQNLVLLDEVNSLAPILDSKVIDLFNEETPQIYAVGGRGTRSSLRIMRHGLAVTEMAVSPLPGNPAAIWTVKTSLKEDHDKYIVVSFVNATMVLAIGETVEEANDTGMITTINTIHVANIGEDGFMQVHPQGIRHIRIDKGVYEWKTPGRKTITHVTNNERQVVIALSGGDILYFEVDVMGQLMEVDKKFLGREVACLSIAPIPEGRQRTRFLAVGDWDNTVRVFSLDPEDCLQSLSVQALPTHPESLCIVEMQGYGTDSGGTLFLNIGLNNGVLLRSVLDSVQGELSDTRTRFLGAKAVKLFRLKVKGANTVLALSSRSWLCYSHQSKYLLTPLSYVPLEHACFFTSEQVPEGIVSISANTLRIFTIEKLGEMFNQTEIPLLLTPRKFIVHPQSNQIVVIETDNNATFPLTESKGGDDMDMELEDNNNSRAQDTQQLENAKSFGAPKGGEGKWASCVRLVDPAENKTLDLIPLTNNEAAFCICTCVFSDRGGEVFVCVGTAKDAKMQPRSCSSGFIHVYRILDNKLLQLVHKTPTDGIPTALCPFQGRILVAIGNSLRIYEMGKKKLLKKCENKSFSNLLTSIATQGDRFYVSDVQEGIQFVKYKKSEQKLYIFADQVTPRWSLHSLYWTTILLLLLINLETFISQDYLLISQMRLKTIQQVQS